jgi:hypothetical protein
MITNDLQHLFDGTHCLSKRQLRDYAAGSMGREEAYAVESHLNTCPLCSAAADGMLAHFPESAGVLAEVDAGFLKEHFKKHSPQIHLNTVAPTVPVTRRIPGGRTIELTSLRTMGIAAGVLLLIASLWWMQNREDNSGGSISDTRPIARAEMPRNSSSSGMPDAESRLARADAMSNDDEAAGTVNQTEKRKDERSSTVALSEAATGAASAAEAEADVAFTPSPVATPASTAAKSAAPVEETKLDKASLASEEGSQTLDAVAVRSRSYNRPLIEPTLPGSRTVLTDKEIEKMPTRNTANNATAAPGVYQSRTGGSLSVGGARAESTKMVVDAPEDGKALYKKGSYTAALKVLRSQISNTSGAEREEAILYAARCHRALGQNVAAEKLLRDLADGTGSRARAARRELRAMGVDVKGESPAARPTRAKAR